MSYEETLDYLYASTPAFHQVGAAAYKPGLENTLRLMAHLNNPHRRFKSVHVAGTNGKGSTSHLLAAVLQQAGYKTGLYTSPHLVDFRERIRIDGQMIPEEEVAGFVETHRAFLEAVRPSFFETAMSMAFDWFAHEQVDIAVVETGLGGRLDSTNVITPEVSIITNIGLDHTEFLGTTLAQIAGEKAGIIKAGVPVVAGEWQAETAPVFERKAAETGSPLVYAGGGRERAASNKGNDIGITYESHTNHIRITRESPANHPLKTACLGELGVLVDLGELVDLEELKELCELKGSYQEKNIQTVVAAVDVLRQRGWRISEEAVRSGLAGVCRLTGLRGRWETLRESGPRVICDTGHNSHGIRYVAEMLREMTGEGRPPFDSSTSPQFPTPPSVPPQGEGTVRMVFGMVADKDVEMVMELLPKEAVYYFTQAQTHRAIKAEEMRCLGERCGLQGRAYGSVKEAVEAAMNDAAAEDTVFIGGSNYVVGEALKMF
ncbi:MAG: bifunctional folylpolyglutamate synthase/dihydrofolate synthase [Paludibacteraceae bacterium]|nr:bifunctional folylpolyglutamate synthase/dihydrofolate synthase [Paludibacteraceae bacterium]